MLKIRWSDKERRLLLKEVQRQHSIHPTMRTLDLLRMAQNIVLPADRKRDIKGNDQVVWVQKERDKWVSDVSVDNYAPTDELPPEIPQILEPPKPDWKAALVEFLSDAMVQVVAEAIVRAREKLDLPLAEKVAKNKEYGSISGPSVVEEVVAQAVAKTKVLKKVAVYGLFSNQEEQVRKALRGCYEFRFLKDVSVAKMHSAAQWADHFVVMTKFVSHDYEMIKKYGNILYVNGAVSSLINQLEVMYLEESK